MYQEIRKEFKEQHKERIRKEYHLEKEEGEKAEHPEGEMPDFSKAIKRLRNQFGFSLRIRFVAINVKSLKDLFYLLFHKLVFLFPFGELIFV